MTKLFPTILICLDFASAAIYLTNGDFKKTIYWVAAGVLTICVTF